VLSYRYDSIRDLDVPEHPRKRAIRLEESDLDDTSESDSGKENKPIKVENKSKEVEPRRHDRDSNRRAQNIQSKSRPVTSMERPKFNPAKL
jgi:hypothetical protein